MRPSFSILAVMFGAAAVTIASPITSSSSSLVRRDDDDSDSDSDDVGVNVASVGQCPMDCWNEAASVAGCDPNTSDDCLCGPFFDAVTQCTAETCPIQDNLAALNFLNPACR